MKKILIVHHPGNAFSNPTLQAFIQYALTHSMEIDIRCRDSMSPKPNFENLAWLKYGNMIGLLKKCFLKTRSVRVVIWLTNFFEALFVFKKKYDLIVGIDREGLIDAGNYAIFLNTPYVFFSFEILFSDEIGLHKKQLEKKFSKNAKLWMVQDEERANCLVEENNLRLDNCFICPIASAGPGKLNQFRLRDALGIDEGKKVAIMIGSLSEWSMSLEIISSAAEWPEGWVLIVHERYGRANQIVKDRFGTEYLESRIFCSNLNTASLDDMGSILAGVDAGLAFYNPIYTTPYNGKNLQYLGLSSGKIATYLRYGIPVITNHIGKYADIIKRYRLGIVLEDTDQLGLVLANMNKTEYTEACQEYFLKKLDANLYMPSLFNQLAAVTRAKGR